MLMQSFALISLLATTSFAVPSDWTIDISTVTGGVLNLCQPYNLPWTGTAGEPKPAGWFQQGSPSWNGTFEQFDPSSSGSVLSFTPGGLMTQGMTIAIQVGTSQDSATTPFLTIGPQDNSMYGDNCVPFQLGGGMWLQLPGNSTTGNSTATTAQTSRSGAGANNNGNQGAGSQQGQTNERAGAGSISAPSASGVGVGGGSGAGGSGTRRWRMIR
ncbi:hypothetical protein T439DRAFT_356706 [Meredithblackwellia eburnea MCA 4105]